MNVALSAQTIITARRQHASKLTAQAAGMHVGHGPLRAMTPRAPRVLEGTLHWSTVPVTPSRRQFSILTEADQQGDHGRLVNAAIWKNLFNTMQFKHIRARLELGCLLHLTKSIGSHDESMLLMSQAKEDGADA